MLAHLTLLAYLAHCIHKGHLTRYLVYTYIYIYIYICNIYKIYEKSHLVVYIKRRYIKSSSLGSSVLTTVSLDIT